MIEKRDICDLIVHPKLEFFFDNIIGEKWTFFVDSVRKYGIIIPLVIMPTGVIISGYQRYRACKELEIKTVPCIIKSFDTTDDEILAIINMNMLQRNVLNSPSVKLGRILLELERIYGVTERDKGGRAPKGQQYRKNLYESIGIDIKVATCSKGIVRMPEEVQSLINEGIVSPRVAYDNLYRLNVDKQRNAAKAIREKWNGHQNVSYYQVKDIVLAQQG